MEIKYVSPKLRQDQITKELGYSSSTLQPYRHNIKMQSPYKLNGLKRTQKTSKDHSKRPEMTSKEPANGKLAIKKGRVKGGDKNEIDDEYSDISMQLI